MQKDTFLCSEMSRQDYVDVCVFRSWDERKEVWQKRRRQIVQKPVLFFTLQEKKTFFGAEESNISEKCQKFDVQVAKFT